ncbi:MAG: phosphatidate cytidylyltransferase [candidate division WOR-3 bacterium]|nr:phosphatidate cytidylyltransferase [candidate division WOR-3 bacterium]MDW8113342.1 phosphatidate cytidylyltransferase [candidate division WOR-3 bacterium]
MNNLLKRIIVALIFGGLLIFCSFNNLLLLLYLQIFLLIAGLELIRIYRLRLTNFSWVYYFYPFLNVFLLIFFSLQKRIELLLFIYFNILTIITLLRRPITTENLVFGIFYFVYLGILPAHIFLLKHLINQKNLSHWIFLFPIFFTWFNDTIAYIFGGLFGKHKIAKDISPNKSGEGLVFSIIFSIPFTLLYLKKFDNFINLIFLSFSLSLLAFLGDLLESLIKREVKLKDSSNLLLAHGGFLDRIDSLLFTIPGFYYFLINK